MNKILAIIVHYTDGTYEEIKSPNKSYAAGDIENGSIVARVETKMNVVESSPSTKILLVEG